MFCAEEVEVEWRCYYAYAHIHPCNHHYHACCHRYHACCQSFHASSYTQRELDKYIYTYIYIYVHTHGGPSEQPEWVNIKDPYLKKVESDFLDQSQFQSRLALAGTACRGIV